VTARTKAPPAGAVLLVDDDPLALRAMERSLRPSFEVYAYDSGEEAVEHVSRGGVAVVLSDIAMPGQSGLELLRAVRGYDADLPVILITGAPTLETATQAIEYGVFRYLSKPFDREELCDTVQHATRLYRLARMKREALELMGTPGASDRVGLDVSFRRALESVWVAFQPIVSVSSRTVFGYEALMRSADAALPGPTHLLDAAERLGALDDLGRLIRRRAAEPLLTAPPETLLFVNLHPRDLLDPDLTDPASPLTQVASRVILEITERASLAGLDDVQGRVAKLRSLGFRVAVDDLGAGYAGLTSFALLEPEIVKIDMALTRDIDRSPVKQKLVASLTGLCREMNLTIVTEGVETAAERDTLVGLGCDLHQGYLFAKPGRAFPEAVY
jgi:EAL domain-containing protein (putative c-di-GMP-specific phosphodiesterase class I)/CheY-like chemotaxis protein